MNFWTPEFKWQFVEWFEKHYPNDKAGSKINWKKFPKTQLQAIYLTYRKKLGR